MSEAVNHPAHYGGADNPRKNLATTKKQAINSATCRFIAIPPANPPHATTSD